MIKKILLTFSFLIALAAKEAYAQSSCITTCKDEYDLCCPKESCFTACAASMGLLGGWIGSCAVREKICEDKCS